MSAEHPAQPLDDAALTQVVGGISVVPQTGTYTPVQPGEPIFVDPGQGDGGAAGGESDELIQVDP
ncbi:hypothetical protein [Falsiroseomonas sp.]|uniref:hypothetical protein n=1 Tax=Falsiroseomonas sp. TaxID=2870721 RepID=UPI003F72B5B5